MGSTAYVVSRVAIESSWLFLGQPHHIAALLGWSLDDLVDQGVIRYDSMGVMWQSPVPSTPPPHKYTRTIKQKKNLNLQGGFRIYCQTEQTNSFRTRSSVPACLVKDRQQRKCRKQKIKTFLQNPSTK